MKKHANLSIFVPHMGCPQSCSFCNQRTISGTQKPPTAQYVSQLCSEFLPEAGGGQSTEIAFFGGSFTAIDKGYMTCLLAAAQPFIKQGRARGVRISTRPDAIDLDILSLLKQYGVSSIELGAQSMLDEVLIKNRRGHLSTHVEKASQLIKQSGFELGLQMMLGLYGDKNPMEGALYTADEFIRLGADTVRIYPTIVVEGTELCRLFNNGEYVPLTLDAAAEITAKCLLKFSKAGIRVIRTGLHDDESLKKGYIAGPMHPAFKQIAESKIYLEKIKASLEGKTDKTYTIMVAKGMLSTAVGQKSCNIISLKNMGFNISIAESESPVGYDVMLAE